MDAEKQKLARTVKDAGSSSALTWKLEAIVGDELRLEPPLEKSYIGILKDKRHISKAMSCLSGCLPCPGHLKRCTGSRIYLAPVAKVAGPQELKELLACGKFDLSLLEDEFEIAEVPAVPALTKSQMSYASKFWPINFHPDLKLEALMSGSVFEATQLIGLERCMRLAVAAAEKAAVGSEHCNGSALIIQPIHGEEVRIVALAASSLQQHPMWHASMLAIDLVGKLHGGGAWSLGSAGAGDNCSELPGREGREVRCKRQRMLDSVDAGGTELPLRYPASLYDIDIQPDLGGFVSAKKEDEKKRGQAYLCTGYWAVLLQEPCPLCAMALLHSRVSRIFYGASNPRSGVLGSKAILHSVSGLNHRYQVWARLLENECLKALKNCRVI